MSTVPIDYKLAGRATMLKHLQIHKSYSPLNVAVVTPKRNGNTGGAARHNCQVQITSTSRQVGDRRRKLGPSLSTPVMCYDREFKHAGVPSPARIVSPKAEKVRSPELFQYARSSIERAAPILLSFQCQYRAIAESQTSLGGFEERITGVIEGAARRRR